jgi:UDP-3-O-[3-hydroxymyristoyl] N-acetylglucosamine deacetylase/3-hydroxyacyl-[acyl-carrier-protein] dehydratase
MPKQKTLAAPLSFMGKGLHTGLDVTMNIQPGVADGGIVFRRTDLCPPVDIPALGEYVVATDRGTTLGRDGVKVSTVEHIMAALWTMGVDNAVVEVDAPETPIMDGSAREYAEAIAKTGLVEQEAEVQYYEVREKVALEMPGKILEIYPDEEFSVSVHIDYNSRVLGHQYAVFDGTTDFAAEIAPCRTFVFLHELEPLFRANLIKGGDIDNALVVVEHPMSEEEVTRLAGVLGRGDVKVNGNGYLNNTELRRDNEPARHKLLDVLGDLALLGVRLKGKVLATRPGHHINTEMVKLLKKNMRRDAVRPRYVFEPAAAPVYDINAVKRILPHRPPFLLVDKIMLIDDENVAGIKNVTMNEPFFTGHFPEEPVMPGVLIVEAMAQCGGILALHNVEEPELWSTYFLKIDGVRFKQKVVPGDTLQFELRLTEPIRRGIVNMEARAYANGQLATEAQLMAQVVKNKQSDEK